ncbi:hypothetical protein G3601_004851 [Salmonella enterica]|uniref:Uncharacterized protein n=1 Tax=Salmonella enterica subsp. enterica serovar Java TaxID=224729 RepID=A0A3Z6QQ69_SALEB|nr:hypothetical protein [Salmonella enterica subsp. enterica serovar Java]EAN9728951.1 hypothetical protein [Salmonella enterica]EBW9699293.1 hypothetical protein [Salmonella enterica subsp. enterica serovar Oranienburg]ECD9518081.1 hypothetical protein [Salmonella enterica subsp. diarizonae]ECN0316166.1 hypothetical protein [Salmonella enterica subsp. enterica serovar Enteritidis]EDQ0183501.1 hypothetical protein [Salmonella enterica subsp. enterica serovar 4,[5],12:b:-]
MSRVSASGHEVMTRGFRGRRCSTDSGIGGQTTQVLTLCQAAWLLASPVSCCQTLNTRLQVLARASLL